VHCTLVIFSFENEVRKIFTTCSDLNGTRGIQDEIKYYKKGESLTKLNLLHF